MITLYAAMLVTLGFLIAALIVVVLLPAYRHRIERFTTEVLKRTLPLTEAEIRADKDRLRADFAMELHKLETKVEAAGMSAARQSVEINRRDAKIQELTEAIADQKMSVDEHENARRVLEQAILDRLPKVEQRLAETRKLLATRDREIRELFATSAKQASALEEVGRAPDVPGAGVEGGCVHADGRQRVQLQYPRPSGLRYWRPHRRKRLLPARVWRCAGGCGGRPRHAGRRP